MHKSGECLARVYGVKYKPFLLRHERYGLKPFLGRLRIARAVVAENVYILRLNVHVRAQYFRRAVNKLRSYFFKRIVAHGNAGHLAAVAVKHCAKHQSRKRSAAARG